MKYCIASPGHRTCVPCILYLLRLVDTKISQHLKCVDQYAYTRRCNKCASNYPRNDVTASTYILLVGWNDHLRLHSIRHVNPDDGSLVNVWFPLFRTTHLARYTKEYCSFDGIQPYQKARLYIKKTSWGKKIVWSLHMNICRCRDDAIIRHVDISRLTKHSTFMNVISVLRFVFLILNPTLK